MNSLNREIFELSNLVNQCTGLDIALEKELAPIIEHDNDEVVILLYARRSLEVIISELCEKELNRPRKTDPLKGIIDKLKKEDKVPEHILTAMYHLNSLANFGAHPKEFDKRQVRTTIINLVTVVEWYISYQGVKVLDKTEDTDVDFESVLLPEFMQSDVDLYDDDSVFVARDEQMGFLTEAAYKSFAGKGQIIFITGEAGSGKTTLVNKFIHTIQQQNEELVVLFGKCDAHTGIGNPYLPFRELLNLLFVDIESKWLAGSISNEHARRLFHFFPFAVSSIIDYGNKLFDNFISKKEIHKKTKQYASFNQEYTNANKEIFEIATQEIDQSLINPNEILDQFTKLIKDLSSKKPLLLVLDDLQWADIGSISLLSHLGQHISNNRVLIIGTYRSAEVAMGRGDTDHPIVPVINDLKRIYGEVSLELDSLDGTFFIKELINSEPNKLGNSFKYTLLQQTKGHPLFTVELWKEMQEKGVLEKDEHGFWVESSSLFWEDLPAKIDAVLGERISRLSDDLKQLLTQASIIGEVFVAEVIAKLTGNDEKQTVLQLSRELDKKHHLVKAIDVKRINNKRLSLYQFRHVLYQQYLYNQLDEVERSYMHEEAGQFLEELYRDNLDEIAVQLARHFKIAGINDKSVLYQYKAADNAKSIYAYDDAIEHYIKTLQLIDAFDQDNRQTEYVSYKIKILERLGDINELKTKHDVARENYDDALSLISANDKILKARLYRKKAKAYENERRFEESLEAYENALKILGEKEFEPKEDWWFERIELINDRIWFFYWQNFLEQMSKSAESIRPFIEKFGKPHQRARFFNGLSLMDYRKYRYQVSDEVLIHAKLALEASLESENSKSILMSYFLLGFSLLWNGSLEKAIDVLNLSYELSKKQKDLLLQSRALSYIIITHRRQRNIDKVEALLPLCVEVSELANMQEYIGLAHANQTWVYWFNGDFERSNSEGYKAIEIWKKLPLGHASMAGKWIGLLPMLDIALKNNDLPKAIEFLKEMLDPTQMIFDKYIILKIEKAVDVYENGDYQLFKTIAGEICTLSIEQGFL